MIKKSSKQSRTKSLPVGIAYGVVAAVVLSLLGTILGAYLMDREMVGASASSVLSMSIRIVSVLASTVITIKLTDHQLLLTAAVTAIVYFFVLIGIAILFFDSPFEAIWQGGIGILAGGALALVICSRKNKEKKHKVHYKK